MADQPNVITDGTNPNNAPKDLIAELVGEGKKYKTLEDFARSRLEADVHIQRLEQENKDYREKLAGSKAVEDVLEAIKAGAASANNSPDPSKNVQDVTGTLTAEQVAKMVTEQVAGLRSAEQRAANLAKANAKMAETFGEKAQEVYLKEAASPELQKIFRELAETNPDKFLSLFVKPQQNNQSLDVTGKNTQAMSLVNTGTIEPGTQAFYAKLRKDSPKQYYSAGVQLQMHNDAMTNPDKYFGRTK